MGLAEAIVESLTQHSTKVVSRDSETEFTGQQFLNACQLAANRFAATTSGETVGIILPTGTIYPIAVFGAIWAGKKPVLLNPLLKPQEVDFIVKETKIDSVVVNDTTERAIAGLDLRKVDLDFGAELGTRAQFAPATTSDNDIAVYLYTSGTTGRPKGVPLSHDNLLSNARAVIDRFRGKSEDVFLGVLPLFHSFGLLGTAIIPLLLGAEVNYTTFTPNRVASLIQIRHCNFFLGVPTMYRLLARSKVGETAMQGLRIAFSGGDALSPTIRDAYFRRFGRSVLEGYGLSETSPVISVNTPEENKPGSVGKVLPGVQVRIQGEDGIILPAGKQGEIQVQGPNVFAGYYQRLEETRMAFTADGWFRTGDLGSLDRDGFLSISGRIKELIIRDGEKIMPREVEEVLEQHPKVLEAAVVGEPDGRHGEAVVAYLIPAGQETPGADELRDHCLEKLADFKVPRQFIVATELPRGPTGKILKRALRKQVPGYG